MKELLAEVVRLHNGMLVPRMYCIDSGGAVDYASTATLCDALWELQGEPLDQLNNQLMRSLQEGVAAELPIVSINEKYIWMGPPAVPCGWVKVSNELIADFSMDEGSPPVFTAMQFLAVSKMVADFALEIRNTGVERMLGYTHRMDFPSQ